MFPAQESDINHRAAMLPAPSQPQNGAMNRDSNGIFELPQLILP